MDPECLGGNRHLPHLLDATGLRGKRDRRLQELLAVAGRHRELKARKKDTDDQSEHMFA
jgi:urease accessory protein UreE